MNNFEFNLQLKEKIKFEAKKFAPYESCGFIYVDKQTLKFEIFACKNTAKNKVNSFSISPQEYLNCSYLGQIIACYHSHTNDNINFSEIDKENSNKYNIHYILYNLNKDYFNFYIPNTEKNHYIGRPFILGISDCFTLMKDYAQRERNVFLNFPKYTAYPKDIKEIGALYEKHFLENGFVKLDKNVKLEKDDGIMMIFPAVCEDYPTHAAAYLGDNMILHQPLNSFSCVNIYDNFYKKHTSYVLRYRG